MLHGGHSGFKGEARVTKLQQTMALEYLKAGNDVITDDTNLNAKFCKEWLKTAAKAGAEVEWHDEFLDVPLAELIERDRRRFLDAQVGDAVIESFYSRYMQGGRPKRPELNADEPATTRQYHGTPGKSPTVLVDLDGTIALNGPDREHPNRGWFDWTRVDEDLPNEPVIDLVLALDAEGYTLLFVSGRTDEGPCRHLTTEWLRKHLGLMDPKLIMRETDCGRKDSIVKLELFDKYIRDNYDVRFCIDDRDQVVKAYRSIGLTVLQVADGNF
jgi:hypothetical protein